MRSVGYTYHNCVYDIVLVVFQRSDGFAARDVCLRHHKLYILRLNASLVNLQGKVWYINEYGILRK